MTTIMVGLAKGLLFVAVSGMVGLFFSFIRMANNCHFGYHCICATLKGTGGTFQPTIKTGNTSPCYRDGAPVDIGGYDTEFFFSLYSNGKHSHFKTAELYFII